MKSYDVAYILIRGLYSIQSIQKWQFRVPLSTHQRKIITMILMGIVVVSCGAAVSHPQWTKLLSRNVGILNSVSALEPVDAQARVSPSSETPSLQRRPMREVHIADNGLLLLRGARVVSISRVAIIVSMDWNSGNSSWNLITNNVTEYIGPSGESQTRDRVHVGDYVVITGTLLTAGDTPAVQTRFVRLQ